MSVQILIGDMRERLAELPDASIDSCVCDPPYHLTSIVKRFGAANAAPAKVGKTGAYARASKGFMGQTWDGGDVAFQPETWAEVLRVLKPGAHLVAFGGTRTFHRLVTAIEDAGFEIRDSLFYIYGSGFPKSHNLDKTARDLVCCCGSEALSQCDMRPLRDTDVSASEYVAEERGQVLFEGLPEQGAPAAGRQELSASEIRPEEPGLEGRRDISQAARELRVGEVCPLPAGVLRDGKAGRLRDGASADSGPVDRSGADPDGMRAPRGSQSAEQHAEQPGIVAGQPQSQTGGAWPLCDRCGKPRIQRGLGTALKPAVEPIVLARKPISERNIALNVLAHGTGAINIDGCRILTDDGYTENAVTQGINTARTSYEHRRERRTFAPSQEGRWPANLCHDGSDEVLAGFPETESGGAPATRNADKNRTTYGTFNGGEVVSDIGANGGSAARFFYCAKATTEERGEGNNHPTVKPVDLMRWLCRLVTPVGGTVLDPFAGSGSTLIAADAEQFDAIGCELSPEYAAIAERRVRDAAGMFADVRAA